MIDIQLRFVHDCSFVRSAATNYDLWHALAKKYGWAPLKPGQAVALVSRMGNQVAFVYSPTSIVIRDKDVRVTVHVHARLHTTSTITPALLQEAANSVGLNLRNFKAFQKYYTKKQLQLKKAKAA